MSKLGSFDDVPESVPAALELAAARSPSTAITMIDNRGREASRRTSPELLESIRAGAARLRAAGLGPNQRCLVCLPTSWEFLETWFGALLLGAYPVAIAPPGALGSPRAQVTKALRVAEAIEASLLVGTRMLIDEAEAVRIEESESSVAATPATPVTPATSPETQLIDIDHLGRMRPETSGFETPSRNLGDTAFLQLTSGSTGLPRAVEITHGGAIHNALAIETAMSRPHGARIGHVVSWLPLYHDMGLIGCVFSSLVNGIDLDLIGPRTFLARPWIWLEVISRRERVFSPAPNFAYQLCVERVPDNRFEQLDLSRWRDATSGSEMVRPETVEAFCERFAVCGFRPESLRPSYGLAEATLGVSLDSGGRGTHSLPMPGEDGSSQVVSTGTALPDNELRIVDDDDRDLAAGEIGTVLVRSPSLMKGYYREPEATAEVIRNGWLDTGDLGFLDEAGELYLTGRTKEILILNGQNLMPHELEWHAEEEIGGGGSLRCGAFSVDAPHGEQPVLVVETTSNASNELAEAADRIRARLGRSLSLPLDELVFVKRGSIPRTSSGKIMRTALRQLYVSDELDVVG